MCVRVCVYVCVCVCMYVSVCVCVRVINLCLFLYSFRHFSNYLSIHLIILIFFLIHFYYFTQALKFGHITGLPDESEFVIYGAACTIFTPLDPFILLNQFPFIC